MAERLICNQDVAGSIPASSSTAPTIVLTTEAMKMTDKKGHPHAELMALYADKSRTDAEEWKNWESRWHQPSRPLPWTRLVEIPLWDESIEYRRKPEPMTLYAVVGDYLVLGVHLTREKAENSINLFTSRGAYRILKFVEVAE